MPPSELQPEPEGIKAVFTPPLPQPSPGPLAEDFARQQISKQLRGNFHSTSLTNSLPTMVSAVNKTALHPAGLQSVVPAIAPREARDSS